MGKPRLIIVIRHAQSEGNKNRDIHQTIPDHRVKLTPDGWQQAYDAGRRLRAMLRPDDTLHFFTSPYRRTRETTEGILATLTSDEPAPSPFKRSNIKVYEEPRLREQDFGNFQPCSAEMERMWQERADYGHFFYRIPNGESAADAYDRVSGFNESLWRQFGDEDFASVCVLVTHGLMSRVFLMKWYHFSVEYFEDLRNINHCEFLIMRRNDDRGKYILETKLRTWSELKRERALLLAKEKGDDGRENGNSKDVSTLARAGTLEVRRRWGGCPDGCNHDKSFKIRQTLADLVQSDTIISNRTAGLAVSETGGSNGTAEPPIGNGVAAGSTHGISNPSFNGTANSQTLVSRRPAARRFQSQAAEDYNAESAGLPSAAGPQIDVATARGDEVVSSPDGTPSFISVEDRLRSRLKSPNLPPHPFERAQLHVGRDFGGSYSGHNSAASDDGHSCSSLSSSDDDGDGGSDLHRRTPTTSATATHTSSTTLTTTAIVNGNGNANGIRKTNGTAPVTTTTTTHHRRHHHHHCHHHRCHHPHRHHHPHHCDPHHRDPREQSRTGRRMRANRLGDHHSSDDADHEADGEHEPGAPGGHDEEVGDQSSGPELVCTGLALEMADEADRVLVGKEESLREERSIRGSVY